MTRRVPRGTPPRLDHSPLAATLTPIGSLHIELHSELQPVGMEWRPPPPPQPSSFGSSREPDYPPPTWCGSGSPARGFAVVVSVRAGAGDRQAAGDLAVVGGKGDMRAGRRR